MINQSRYVKIVSGVGAGSAISEKKLILRVITSDNKIPPSVVMEFKNADAVGSFFGLTSEEYKRALSYFGFISKQIFSPNEISFARQVIDSISAAIIGDSQPKDLANLKTFGTGNLILNFDGTEVNVGSINLSIANSLSEVADIVQKAIVTVATTLKIEALQNCQVSYTALTNQFNLSCSVQSTGSGTISVTRGLSVVDISPLLGWSNAGTVYIKGQGADTPLEAAVRSDNVSNNYGSFVFQRSLSLEGITTVAAWNHEKNNSYMFLTSTTLDKIAAYFAALKGFSGTGLMVKALNLEEDFIDQAPAEILAATNYNKPNSTQNYMYYQFPSRNVTVTSDKDADTADANRANYIGATQTAGQALEFFQRGVLMGGSQAAVDMNVFSNEMWLKSAIIAQIFSLFLNIGRVPANEDGRSTIMAVIQVVIDNAKVNGVISVGKKLKEVQKQYVTQLTNDDSAWRQVENIGYWLNVDFQSEVTVDGRKEEFATYDLIYGKDDAIRRVVGRDVLI